MGYKDKSCSPCPVGTQPLSPLQLPHPATHGLTTHLAFCSSYTAHSGTCPQAPYLPQLWVQLSHSLTQTAPPQLTVGR